MAPAETSLDETWSHLTDDPDAVLIDVRTTAEWNFVGLPDLTPVGKQVRTVEWIQFPGGSPNTGFVAQATEGLSADQKVFLLCRSGARSRAAGEALEAAGFPNVFNVTAGFEGDIDVDGHRHGGWKDQLPWKQS